MTDRALAPVVGTLLLVGVVLATAAVVAAGAGALAAAGPGGTADTRPSPPPADATAPANGPVAFSLSASGDRVAVTYERGPPVPVADLRLRISVAGEPLTHQPPVPFFSARGFRSGPTGPFNVGSDGVWSAGETGAVTVAGTNDPSLAPGRTVTVRLFRAGSSRPLATLTAAIAGN